MKLNDSKELDSLDFISHKVSQYFCSLWDSTIGGFRFTPAQPVTLMATSYTILGLELTNSLDRLNLFQKEAVIDYLQANVKHDGSFVDPLFNLKDSLSEYHDLGYFQEETTTLCQQALDALSADPPPPRDWKSDHRVKRGISLYFEALDWQDAWMDSNPVMFVLSQLCHDAERHQKQELLNYVDSALDWLDNHQSPDTGLWRGPHEVSLVNAMAATFHFTFFYRYRGRPIKYLEKIIDSCLSLQRPHGLFSEGGVVGQTCLDFDAIDLLAKASAMSDYREKDVKHSMTLAYKALLRLQNNVDGGFADSKEKLQRRQSYKYRLIKKLGASRWISPTIRVPVKGTYHVCWKFLSCNKSDSNAFSTWLRFMSLSLINHKKTTEYPKKNFTFRRLPFLGFHI